MLPVITLNKQMSLISDISPVNSGPFHSRFLCQCPLQCYSQIAPNSLNGSGSVRQLYDQVGWIFA
jgi:hypothetical protein